MCLLLHPPPKCSIDAVMLFNTVCGQSPPPRPNYAIHSYPFTFDPDSNQGAMLLPVVTPP